MKAKDNKNFDRIITLSNEEKCELLAAFNELFENTDDYYTVLSESSRERISDLFNALNW